MKEKKSYTLIITLLVHSTPSKSFFFQFVVELIGRHDSDTENCCVLGIQLREFRGQSNPFQLIAPSETMTTNTNDAIATIAFDEINSTLATRKHLVGHG
jgi:hypothetical protein